MERLITTVAAFAMITPSIAFAEPAAQALSLNNSAAVQPVRASSATGKKLNAGTGNVVMLLIAIAVLGGGACAIWCGGGDSN